MAVLTGAVDGTVLGTGIMINPLPVDSIATVFNFGVGALSFDISGTTVLVISGNSIVFSVPKGSTVTYFGASSGSWQLAVPD